MVRRVHDLLKCFGLFVSMPCCFHSHAFPLSLQSRDSESESIVMVRKKKRITDQAREILRLLSELAVLLLLILSLIIVSLPYPSMSSHIPALKSPTTTNSTYRNETTLFAREKKKLLRCPNRPSVLFFKASTKRWKFKPSCRRSLTGKPSGGPQPILLQKYLGNMYYLYHHTYHTISYTNIICNILLQFISYTI